MKKRLLIEASTITDLEKMQQFEAGTRRENIKACKIDKLIKYYKICLANDLNRARAQIEGEFDSRDLSEFIAPIHFLKHPNTGMFTEKLARLVIDAKGDAAKILDYAYKSFSHSCVIISAYVLAIVAGEIRLELDLRRFIQAISTYDVYMKDYLTACMSDTALVEHFSNLLKEMEAYKSWT